MICIGYVVFAENLLTGIAFHWKKVCNNKESYKHQVPLRINGIQSGIFLFFQKRGICILTSSNQNALISLLVDNFPSLRNISQITVTK